MASNHSITEPAAWDATTPQVPDAGPASFRDLAAATIEAFVTILGKRTQYLKTTQDSHISSTATALKKEREYRQRDAVINGITNLRLIATIPDRVTAAKYYTQSGIILGTVGVDDSHYRLLDLNGNGTGNYDRANGYDQVVQSVAYDQSTASYLYVGIIDKIIQRVNGGVTTEVLNVAGSQFYAIDCNTTGKCIAGGVNGSFYKSTDGGASWSSATSPASSETIVDIRYFSGLWILTTTAGRLFTSPDGDTWTQRIIGASDFLYQSTLRCSNLGYYTIDGGSVNGLRWNWSSNGVAWSSGVSRSVSIVPFPTSYGMDDIKWAATYNQIIALVPTGPSYDYDLNAYIIYPPDANYPASFFNDAEVQKLMTMTSTQYPAFACVVDTGELVFGIADTNDNTTKIYATAVLQTSKTNLPL